MAEAVSAAGSRCRALAAALLTGSLLVRAPGAQAQSRVDVRLLAPLQDSARVSPGKAMIGSVVLPGAGQYLLGADRWVPYAAVEVWAWITYFGRRGDARSLGRQYRDLAWSTARRVSVGGRADPAFDYFETMSHWESSGALDTDPRQAGIQPEIDPTTFNGDQWLLARSLFFPGGFEFPPGTQPYDRAMQYYLSHAIGPNFAWAWGDSNLEQQAFRELIRRSDEASRTATQMLGLILVNHMVSAIDALVLGRTRDTLAGLRLESRIDRAPTGPRLRIGARFAW
jgi:hypothetical protein